MFVSPFRTCTELRTPVQYKYWAADSHTTCSITILRLHTTRSWTQYFRVWWTAMVIWITMETPDLGIHIIMHNFQWHCNTPSSSCVCTWHTDVDLVLNMNLPLKEVTTIRYFSRDWWKLAQGQPALLMHDFYCNNYQGNWHAKILCSSIPFSFLRAGNKYDLINNHTSCTDGSKFIRRSFWFLAELNTGWVVSQSTK